MREFLLPSFVQINFQATPHMFRIVLEHAGTLSQHQSWRCFSRMSLEVRKWLGNPNYTPTYKCRENLVYLFFLGGGATGLLVLGISSRWKSSDYPAGWLRRCNVWRWRCWGAPWNPPGEELGLLVFKVPKSQANPWKPTYPTKMDGWKMKFAFKTVPFQETC